MICAHFSLLSTGDPSEDWVPPAIRDAECLLRKSDPSKWSKVLNSLGEDVEPDDCLCMRNIDSNWDHCPLYVPRGGRIKLSTGKPKPYSLLPGAF